MDNPTFDDLHLSGEGPVRRHANGSIEDRSCFEILTSPLLEVFLATRSGNLDFGFVLDCRHFLLHLFLLPVIIDYHVLGG
mmetsp:Transcript_5037/g.9284  ORF Transcript_5037/g.9284 Transcript_5037/m.9284 type:complete len:80 (+) Transcript_5037:446-685(+)